MRVQCSRCVHFICQGSLSIFCSFSHFILCSAERHKSDCCQQHAMLGLDLRNTRKIWARANVAHFVNKQLWVGWVSLSTPTNNFTLLSSMAYMAYLSIGVVILKCKEIESREIDSETHTVSSLVQHGSGF